MEIQVKIKNLTPHDIILNGIKIPKTNNPMRVKTEKEKISDIDIIGIGKIPVYKTKYTEYIDGLPDIDENTIYIVSRIVRQALENLYIENKINFSINNFLVPEDLIRDSEGQVIGCNALSI